MSFLTGTDYPTVELILQHYPEVIKSLTKTQGKKDDKTEKPLSKQKKGIIPLRLKLRVLAIVRCGHFILGLILSMKSRRELNRKLVSCVTVNILCCTVRNIIPYIKGYTARSAKIVSSLQW